MCSLLEKSDEKYRTEDIYCILAAILENGMPWGVVQLVHLLLN